MEESHASRAQRVDLLGYDRQKAGDEKRAYRAIARRLARRPASALLLAWLPSSQAKSEKMV